MSLINDDLEWSFNEVLGCFETKRVLIHDGTDYLASYHVMDVGNGKRMPFFHLQVWFLNHNVLRDMLKEWKAFRTRTPDRIFTMADVDTPALDRLRLKFGFKFLAEIPCTDGKVRRLFVHDASDE